MRQLVRSITALLVVLLVACAHGGSGGSSDQNRLTAEEIARVDVSTLYEVVHRLRPRWLEVRSPRAFETETEILVFLNRTLLGGADQLHGMGVDVAASLEYMPGSAAQARLPGIGTRHVEGAIIVNTVERRD